MVSSFSIYPKFKRDPTQKINILSLPSFKRRMEIKEDRSLRAILHGMISNDDFESCNNVPKKFRIVATVTVTTLLSKNSSLQIVWCKVK